MSNLSQFTLDEAKDSWSRLSKEVLPSMKVSEPHWSENPELAYYRGDPAERELLVQCLIDLGYLPEPENAARSYIDSEIRTAVAQWRLDEQALPATYVHTNTLFQCREFLAPGEMARFSAQVGFENEIHLPVEPAIGEQSLLTRIVRFRLRTFNLSSEPTTAPYSAKCQQALLALCAELKLKVQDGTSSRLEMIHLLGNAAGLSKLLMRHWGTWVFVFKHDRDVLKKSIATHLETLAKSNKDFLALYKPKNRQYERLFISCGKHRKRQVTGYHSSGHPRVRFGDDGFRPYRPSKSSKWIRRELERLRRPSSVEEAETHLINRLGLELLQLRLWMLGYYQGRVDGQWGPLSFAALQQLLIDEKAKVKKLVFSLKNNYVALNLRYLFKRFLPKIDHPTASAKLQDVRALEKEMHAQLKTPKQWSTVQDAYRKMEHDEATLYQDKIRRKRYGGIRGILAALGRMFKRVAQSLAKVVRAILAGIKKLLNSALQLFRNIVRNIRKGLRLVGLAVKRFYYWLTKKPYVTGHPSRSLFVLSRFDWDGDALHFVQKGTGTYDIRRHHRYLKRLNLSFAIVAKLAIKAIDLLMSAAMMNWIMLAWDLYRLITPGFWKEVKTMLRHYRETLEPLGPLPLK